MPSSAAELVERLGNLSIERAWSPYTGFDWPETLDPEAEYYMTPELMSLHGTESYESLSEVQRKRLSFHEINNLFSFVLLGERAVIGGMTEVMYRKDTMGPITDYMHHFVDEENRHMVMFSLFCNKYLGKVYPEKKVTIDRELAPGEADLVFYCRVLIVEELGDVYNRRMMIDENINDLVRQINEYHHLDESRHLSFGRAWAAELFKKHSENWTAEQLEAFQSWLGEFFVSSWSDFYNPSVYRDAGLDNAYQLRLDAMSNPTQRAFRESTSAKLLKFFLKHGFLNKAPTL
jgi:hypothetical protein